MTFTMPQRPAMIAALFVDKDGIYGDREGVEAWGVESDARLYAGPHPCVVHPPCKRWGRYWSGGPSPAVDRLIKGDDGGCFASALHSIRLWGGVLEHPADTHAWTWHGLRAPDKNGGWSTADAHGFACHVEQGFYGHPSAKATWLYAVRCDLPELRWGEGDARTRMDAGARSTEQRRRMVERDGSVRRIAQVDRAATPSEFADLLLKMARSVSPTQAPHYNSSGVQEMLL